MAVYVLLDGPHVVYSFVADSPESLGYYNELYEIIDTTNLSPTPSVGWTRIGGKWFPPNMTDAAKALWNGNGFDPVDGEEVIDVEEVKPRKALFRRKAIQ